MSHAAAYWLGLVKVLCVNKAPRIKRQVASIDKKSDFRAKSGHFRTSSPNTASRLSEETDDTENGHFRSEQHSKSKRCTVSRTPNYRQGRRPLECDLAKTGTSATGSSTAKMKHLRQLERNRRHQNRVTRSIQDQNKKITDRVKDGPFSNKTGNNSNAKHGPKMKHTSKKAPRRKYYRPSDDTKTFQINNKGPPPVSTRPQTHPQTQ